MQFTAKIRRSSTVYRNWRNLRRIFGDLHGVRFRFIGQDYVAEDDAAVAAHLAALNNDRNIEVAAIIATPAPRIELPDDRPIDELTLEELDRMVAEGASNEPEAPASPAPRRGRPPKAGWK